MDKGICGNRIHISDLHPSYVGCFSFTGIWVGSLSESSHMHCVYVLISQSKELTKGPPEFCSALSFIGVVHIGTNFIWFG